MLFTVFILCSSTKNKTIYALSIHVLTFVIILGFIIMCFCLNQNETRSVCIFRRRIRRNSSTLGRLSHLPNLGHRYHLQDHRVPPPSPKARSQNVNRFFFQIETWSVEGVSLRASRFKSKDLSESDVLAIYVLNTIMFVFVHDLSLNQRSAVCKEIITVLNYIKVSS